MADQDETLAGRALETVTLGGGCFWCMEAVFDALEGVVSVESGYMGGILEHPSYAAVCSGGTGHAEVVQVRFDPGVISFADVLEVFFAIHDPTTPDRQGNDIGSQYRSVIFFESPAQEAVARRTLDQLAGSGQFAAPIVTQLVPASRFWPAEAYHQDYFRNNPQQPYCRAVIWPKLAKFRVRFEGKLKSPSNQGNTA